MANEHDVLQLLEGNQQWAPYLTEDERAALTAAEDPSVSNPYATIADLADIVDAGPADSVAALSSNDAGVSTDYSRGDHDHGPPTLADVLTAGNDTGGLGIVNDTTGGGGAALASIEADAASTDTANADQIANTVDNIASAVATATASGVGGADVRRTATTAGSGSVANASANANAPAGDTDVSAIATSGGNGNATANVSATSDAGNSFASTAAISTSGTATADVSASGGAGTISAVVTATATANGNANSGVNAIVAGNGNANGAGFVTVGGTGNAVADLTVSAADGNADGGVLVTGSGNATASRGATATGGTANASTTAWSTNSNATAELTAYGNNGANFASIGPIADSTRAEIQINGLPLYTEAAGAPGVTFVSYFYRDSTAVTGGTYLWDFVAGAYVKIAGPV